MLHFKDTTQDEKCLLSPNKQEGTKQGVGGGKAMDDVFQHKGSSLETGRHN